MRIPIISPLRPIAVLAAAAAALCAPAASAGPVTGPTSVQILRATSLTKTATLNFGKVVPSAAASTVVIATNGTRTCSTGLKCLGTTKSGAFAVTGTTGQTVTIAFTNATITLSDGAGHTMSTTLTLSRKTLPLTTGAGSFTVGGTLKVGAKQAAGIYSGTYQVTVAYQ